MSEQEWLTAFQPIYHTPEWGWTAGALLDPFGEHRDLVMSHVAAASRGVDGFLSRLWTVTENGDDPDLWEIVPGYHLVNRVGHLLTVVPQPEGFSEFVIIE
tara:strand:+ start:47 stop:349 length:303 start_codon:yes stop_codon:yes gene_type:complete